MWFHLPFVCRVCYFSTKKNYKLRSILKLPLFENDDDCEWKETQFFSAQKDLSLLTSQNTSRDRCHCECCQNRLPMNQTAQGDNSGKPLLWYLQFLPAIDSSCRKFLLFVDSPGTFVVSVQKVQNTDREHWNSPWPLLWLMLQNLNEIKIFLSFSVGQKKGSKHGDLRNALI